jgi:probable phosphoglycerate mutase
MLTNNMRQCILHLIRHGQTDWNAEKRLQGHVDIPLNEAGKAEAQLVAQEFKGRSLSAIYSSPLQRAHGTAQIINQHHQHEIKTYDALKEATYGSMEGVKVDEYRNKCKEVLPSFHHMTLRQLLHFKLVPEAESYFEVYQRVKPLLDEIIHNHLGEEVLIVSHGKLMGAIIAMLEHDVKAIQILNTGCLTLSGDRSKIEIREHKRINIERET